MLRGLRLLPLPVSPRRVLMVSSIRFNGTRRTATSRNQGFQIRINTTLVRHGGSQHGGFPSAFSQIPTKSQRSKTTHDRSGWKVKGNHQGQHGSGRGFHQFFRLVQVGIAFRVHGVVFPWNT